MILSLFHDNPASESWFTVFRKEHVLLRLKAIDKLARRKGPGGLDPRSDKLIRIGMELDAAGRVRRNRYGMLRLGWEVTEHPEWPGTIQTELAGLLQEVRESHGGRVRYLIWTAMDGSGEEVALYGAAGLLKRSPRCFLLDSTDPAQLEAVLGEIERRSGRSLPEALRSTLVVGAASGPVPDGAAVNLERLASLFDRHAIDCRPNFLCLAAPGSALDGFAAARRLRRVERQPDGEDTTAGRHAGPLTRSSLYALGMAGADLAEWCDGAALGEESVETAWRLSAFMHAQARSGRDKITLVLPGRWSGAGPWTKQAFEQSLGGHVNPSVKIVLERKIRLANYRSPRDPAQDRAFIAVKVRGLPNPAPDKASLLRRAGYPVASLVLGKGTPLSAYMQFVHYTVFGLAYLWNTNFVGQPAADAWGRVAGRLHEGSLERGLEESEEWRKFHSPERRTGFGGRVTLCQDLLPAGGEAPEMYASLVRRLLAAGEIDCAALTFFGDTRHSARGRALLRLLDRSAERFFRSRLKVPADVGEGPAATFASQESVAGRGRCLSTLVLVETAAPEARHHRAQYLAVRETLAQRGRPAATILLVDLEEETLASLGDFFRRASSALRTVRA